MAQPSSILDRWRDHRQTVEINIFGGCPPQVSHGEFLILAAVEMMMATLDDVLAKVTEENTIEQSLSTLLDGIVVERDALKAQVVELQAELAAAGQDTAKTQAILDAIDSNETLLNMSRRKLMTAVTTGTPGGPPAADPAPSSTLAGGQGDDTLASGSGNDTISGAETGGIVGPVPVAVVSTDPTVVQQVPGDTPPQAVIVTDHPTDGTTLVTPVTSPDTTPVPPASVTVDPATGVPTVDPSTGVTLGDTTVAPDQTITSAADTATADPSSVVS